MKTISLSMIVKNEEKVLARCLNSVYNLVDEIVIVDTGSTDNTINIAKEFGAKVFHYEWNHNFSSARNFALEHSTSDWNLVLDADEYLQGRVKKELYSFINNEEAIGRIERIDKYSSDGEVKFSKCFISRLFPAGIKYKGKIHEQLVSTLPRKMINIVIEHDGYYLSKKSARNIPILLEEVKSNPGDSYYLYQLANEYRIEKNFELATEYFEKSYRLLKGNESYFTSVVINYLYTLKEINDFVKALKIVNENNTFLNRLADFHFIKALLYMDLIYSSVREYSHLLPKIEQCYLKCIEIGDSNEFDSIIGNGSYNALYNLGVYYETTGKIAKAKECYRRSAEYDFRPAIQRFELL